MGFIYQNPAAAEEERVRDLLSRMNLEEKRAQMCLDYPLGQLLARDDVTPESFETAYAALGPRPEGSGSTYLKWTAHPALIDLAQRRQMEQTRLGIPILFMGESLHGTMLEGSTVFPQAIGLGAAFDPELLEEIAGVCGREARMQGLRLTYAPDLDISRDPRWGRVEETYGEDPCLTGRLGVAYVRGLQAQGVAASPKHYVAHGTPEGGVNIGPVHAGERELREVMLPPFAAAIREAGAMSLMPAYSELDGVPLHASRFLLTNMLRGELGFDGFITSDFGAVSMLHRVHQVARDPLEAGRMALWAGVDVEAPHPYGFGEEFWAAAAAGEIPMEQIDTAVARILRIKFRLGLFEDPYAQIHRLEERRSPAALALARRAASASMVLLKNEGLLPFSEKVKTLAVVGPNAATAQLGDYTAPAALQYAVSPLAGLRARLGEDTVRYALGCGIAGGTDAELEAAIEAVRASDAAVVVLGDTSHSSGGIGWGGADSEQTVTCGEGFDVSNLSLPPAQLRLLDAVTACGKPVALVLCTGRPYTIPEDSRIGAVLMAWYPGEQGGHALAEVLFGDAEPGGRLPVSIPRSAGNLPCYYNYKPSARGYYKKPGSPENPGRDYVFDTPAAQYFFGYGLSYTKFAYDNLKAAQTGPFDFEITVTLRNIGARAGSETAQLYLRDEVCRVTPFVRRLRGFQKVFLAPGEEKCLRFMLGFDDLSFINEQMRPEVEPGDFVVELGGLTTGFEVLTVGC